MKKQFTKKLALNKRTVTNLDDNGMTDVKGGSWPADCRTNDCPTTIGIICQYTCGCPTSVDIRCEYTCNCTLTECATACNSNPCC